MHAQWVKEVEGTANWRGREQVEIVDFIHETTGWTGGWKFRVSSLPPFPSISPSPLPPNTQGFSERERGEGGGVKKSM